jgi:hypothetical protein
MRRLVQRFRPRSETVPLRSLYDPSLDLQLASRRVLRAVSRQISIGDFQRRIRPSAAAIRHQKQHSSSPPSCARRQYRIYSDIAVFGATGWPPGAIGPFSLSAQTNVWLDGGIFRAPTIYCGSRELNEVLEISSVPLLTLPRVRVARVSAD